MERHGNALITAGLAESPTSEPRSLVAVACRILYACGHNDMVWGHVAMRDAEGRGVWLKGSRLGLDEVTAEDVVLVSWEGEILEGSAGRHKEYPIHTEIMARRIDVNAVVHTHPVHAIAFAATGRALTHLSHEAMHFVPPDIPRFERTSDIVDTPELGRALADALGDQVAVLMPHHGITTVGASVGAAVAAAVQLERACQIALLAGPDAEPAAEEEAVRKQQRSAHRLQEVWTYLLRTTA